MTEFERSIRRIFAGVDGSAASVDALRWAIGLADTAGGKVTAVHAFTPGRAELSPDYSKVLRAGAERRLAGWCAGTTRPGSVDSLVVDGDPDVLLATATRMPTCSWSEPEAPVASPICTWAASPTTSPTTPRYPW